MAHTPTLSDILPFTKGSTPPLPIVNRTFQYKKTGIKRNRTENIAGVDWYPRFVPHDEVIALSDIIPYNELTKMFTVCVNVAQPSDWKKSDKPIRFFAAFKSALDLIHYIKKIPQERWSFFEYILGSHVQKLYFDIDIKMDDFIKVFPNGNIDVFAWELITKLVTGIVDSFEDRGVQINLAQHILLFSSHSQSKRSFHLVVDGYAVVNNEENFILASEVLEDFPESYREFIDTGMYSSKQQFRLYGSQKTGSGRPKIFVEKWLYGTRIIQSSFYENLKAAASDQTSFEALKFTTLFLASCVTVTTNCQLLSTVVQREVQSLTGNRPKMWNETTAFDNDIITNEIKTEIEARADPRLFDIYKLTEIKGSLIVLVRHPGISNHCSLCNHVHDSENGFLTVNSKGKVYFHCHAFRRHQKRDSQGNIIGSSAKYMLDVSDLLPASEEMTDLADLHVKSIIQQIVAQLPKVDSPLQNGHLPPNVKTIHQEMRLIGSQPNAVIKARKRKY